MSKKNVVIFISLLILSTFSLSACASADKDKIENVVIVQVTNGGTLQNRGGYTIENGTLAIFKEIQLSKNINQDPSSLTTSDSEKEEIEKLLANDFTEEDQHPEQTGLFQTYDRKIKKAYAQIDKENKKTYLYGEHYKKEFTWVNDQGTRLMDSNKVEYSFSQK
ncbi:MULTISPECIES: hypothetical protein [Enterococcus]|uniref:hypothetical protein n=1 Tax=Enterococcus TaxID=1350 RepID=UPI0011067315|nr:MULTISPECIES: hypothetical protein [Enterococcus]MDB1679853.1 hypothetical protein [Enterococcus durans]